MHSNMTQERTSSFVTNFLVDSIQIYQLCIREYRSPPWISPCVPLFGSILPSIQTQNFFFIIDADCRSLARLLHCCGQLHSLGCCLSHLSASAENSLMERASCRRTKESTGPTKCHHIDTLICYYASEDRFDMQVYIRPLGS